MDEERQMILRMLKEGKISVEEADALLRALEDEDTETARSTPVEETRQGSSQSFAEFGEELGSAIREIVDTIPKEVLKQVRPSFFSVLHSLRDLVEGGDEDAVEIPMAPGDRLEIRNAWGDIRFTASTDDRLRLTLRKRVWAASGEDAVQFARGLPIAPERSGRTVTISVPRVEGRRLRVDMEVMVPSGVEVSAAIAKGDIRAEGLRGSTELRVARGDLAVSDHQGDVRMDLASGDISIQRIDGDVELNVRSGDVSVTGAHALRGRVTNGDLEGRDCGPIVFDGVSCNVELSGITGRDVRVRAVSGDVSVQFRDLSDQGEVHLETVSGDIELSVPAGARASVDASVRTGRITSTLPLSQVSSDRRSLRGILNEPGAKVVLRTVSGNIDIAGHET